MTPRRTAPSASAFGATLVLAMAMGPLLHHAVAALAPFLVADLGLSRTQIGLFTTVLFIVAALASPSLGKASDRLHGRRVLVGLFVLGAAAAGVLAVARSFAWFLAAAVVVSVPMAVANPVTNLLVRARLPEGRRGFLMGVKQSGVKIAQATAGFSLPPLALRWGWRWALALVPAVAAAGLLATLRSVPADEAAESPRHAAPQPRAAPSLPPAVRWLAAYAVCMGIGQAAAGSYLTLYAFEAVGLGEVAAGVVGGVVGLVGAVSRVGWAPLAERVTSLVAPLRLVAAGAAAATLLILAAPRLGPAALAVGAIAFGATAPVWNVIGMLSVFRLVDHASTGRTTGIVFGGFSLGFVVGPVLFGLGVDRSGTYGFSWAGVVLAFACAVAVTAGIERALPTPVTDARHEGVSTL